MLLEDLKDKRFEQERVVDSNHLYVGLTKPARLSATRDGLVHDIVGYEKECLELTRNKVFTSVLKSTISTVIHWYNGLYSPIQCTIPAHSPSLEALE